MCTSALEEILFAIGRYRLIATRPHHVSYWVMNGHVALLHNSAANDPSAAL
jgi:hypothetical protein